MSITVLEGTRVIATVQEVPGADTMPVFNPAGSLIGRIQLGGGEVTYVPEKVPGTSSLMHSLTDVEIAKIRAEVMNHMSKVGASAVPRPMDSTDRMPLTRVAHRDGDPAGTSHRRRIAWVGGSPSTPEPAPAPKTPVPAPAPKTPVPAPAPIAPIAPVAAPARKTPVVAPRVQPQGWFSTGVKLALVTGLSAAATTFLACEQYVSPGTALSAMVGVTTAALAYIIPPPTATPAPVIPAPAAKPPRPIVDFTATLAQGPSQQNIQLKWVELPKLLNISGVDTVEQSIMFNVLQGMCQIPRLMNRMMKRLQSLTEKDLFSNGAADVGHITQTNNPDCPKKKLDALLSLSMKFAVITDKTRCAFLSDHTHKAELLELRDLFRTITENGLEDLRGLTEANKQAILQAHVMLELYVTLVNSTSISKGHLTHLRAALQRQGNLGKGLPEELLNAFVTCIDGELGSVRQIDINEHNIAASGQFPDTVYALVNEDTPYDQIECSIANGALGVQKYRAVAVMFGGENTLTTSVNKDGKWYRGQNPRTSAVEPAQDRGDSIATLGRDLNTKPHLIVYERDESLFSRLSSKLFA